MVGQVVAHQGVEQVVVAVGYPARATATSCRSPTGGGDLFGPVEQGAGLVRDEGGRHEQAGAELVPARSSTAPAAPGSPAIRWRSSVASSVMWTPSRGALTRR